MYSTPRSLAVPLCDRGMHTDVFFSTVDGLVARTLFPLLRMLWSYLTLLVALIEPVLSADAGNATVALGPSAFTVPGGFPTSAFRNYYNSPTATVSQVQPVISDPVNVCVGV